MKKNWELIQAIHKEEDYMKSCADALADLLLLYDEKPKLRLFPQSKEDAEKYLEGIRWEHGVVCPFCRNTKTVYKTNRGYKCGNKECYKKFSVISQTPFENTKLPVSVWIDAMMLIISTNGDISTWDIASKLNISQKTSHLMVVKMREILNKRTESAT